MARELTEVQDLAIGDFFRFPYGYVLWEVVYADSRTGWMLLKGSAYYNQNQFTRYPDYQVTRVV